MRAHALAAVFAVNFFAAGAVTIPLEAQPLPDSRTPFGTLAKIPSPLPFPVGSSIFQWDLQCIPQKYCSFTGLGLKNMVFRSVTIVLAKLTVGEQELPTYFLWGTLITGDQIESFTQDPLVFTSANVNMKLIATGAPGL